MRRTAAVFLAFLVAFLCVGCSGQIYRAEKINFAFQCKANIVYGDQKLTCNLSRSAPGVASIQVVSGDLNGLLYNWSGEDFSISFGGLNAKSDRCVLPKTSFAYIIKQALDSASKNEALTKTHGNEYSANMGGVDFTVVTDGGGQIQKISIPQRSITAELYKFTQLGL